MRPLAFIVSRWQGIARKRLFSSSSKRRLLSLIDMLIPFTRHNPQAAFCVSMYASLKQKAYKVLAHTNGVVQSK
jgi:hypothetical protein